MDKQRTVNEVKEMFRATDKVEIERKFAENVREQQIFESGLNDINPEDYVILKWVEGYDDVTLEVVYDFVMLEDGTVLY